MLGWLRQFHTTDALNPRCNLPDTECVDLRKPEALTNYTVFLELMRRTQSGQDVLDRMGEFIRVTAENAPAYCAWQEARENGARK